MTAARGPGTCHVAVDGDDRGDGTGAAPFATLWRAAEWLRERRARGAAGGLAVLVRDGLYRVERPVVVGAAETSAAGATVFRAVSTGAVLSGARPIPALGPAAADIRSEAGALVRLDRRRFAIDLPRYGCSTLDLGTFGHALPIPPPPPFALVDGARLDWARWPVDRALDGVVAADRPGEFGIDVDPSALAGLGDEDALFVEMVVHHPWRWFQGRVLALDRVRGRIRTSLDAGLGAPGQTATQLRFLNAAAGLASPETAVLDPALRRIVFAYGSGPDGALHLPRSVEVTGNEAAIFHLDGARDLRIEGFHLRDASGSGIFAERCDGLSIADCRVTRFGREGLGLSGARIEVRDCRVGDTGLAGIRIDSGDAATLVAGRSTVGACEVERWGRWKRVYEPAIRLRGAGTEVTACELTDGPHVAVELSGNDHVLAECTISKVAGEFADMGAVYVNQGETPLRRGSKIVRNVFHAIGDRREETHAVFLDGASCGVEIRGNVFLRIGGAARSAAVRANGPSDVTVRRNLFLDCPVGVHIEFHLADWGAREIPVLRRGWADAVRVLAVPHNRHLARYPELARFAAEDRLRPPSNTVRGNLFVESRERGDHEGAVLVRFAEPSLVAMSDNPIVRDAALAARLVAQFARLFDGEAARRPSVGAVLDEAEAILGHDFGPVLEQGLEQRPLEP